MAPLTQLEIGKIKTAIASITGTHTSLARVTGLEMLDIRCDLVDILTKLEHRLEGRAMHSTYLV